MRKNLRFRYLDLVLIILISSFFLIYVVAFENAKNVDVYVAAASKSNTTRWTPEIILYLSKDSKSKNKKYKEKILPNYKKVKKSLSALDEKDKVHSPVEYAFVKKPQKDVDVRGTIAHRVNERQIIKNDFHEVVNVDSVATLSSASRVISLRDAIIESNNGQHDNGVINEVPKVVESVVIQKENFATNQPYENDYSSKIDHSEFKKLKKNLTMFLIFFWIIWFSQIIAISTMFMSLPDITEIPAVTVTELPLEVLEPTRANVEAIILDTSNDITQAQENQTADTVEKKNLLHADEQIIKINDSGGGSDSLPPTNEIPLTIDKNIPSENEFEGADEMGDIINGEEEFEDFELEETTNNGSGYNINLTSSVNVTVEEVPIPVFSEWAQKKIEQEVNITTDQKKNKTKSSKKLPQLKLRSKNYASPDCGAKILAANIEASHTGAVLSSSKDEYMLSPCGSRIWFVVELCEAVQAQKIEMANFELFSSSPKNFSVAVSTRFPTRGWSNVGRFAAQDKRTLQSFDLHPYLFGKFVRVDIHSHYSNEHFCPVSLFRLYGTSEFEAFETENSPGDDDFDDDVITDHGGGVLNEIVNDSANDRKDERKIEGSGYGDLSIFKSASDAVISIVKRAAEVLVKPVSNHYRSRRVKRLCETDVQKLFSCAECNSTLVERINIALSCEPMQLSGLLNKRKLRNDLINSKVCAKQYGFQTSTPAHSCVLNPYKEITEIDIKQSYYLTLLPTDYIGALCFLYMQQYIQTKSENSSMEGLDHDDDNTDLPLNLTIEKELRERDFEYIEKPEKNILNNKDKFTSNYDKEDLQENLSNQQPSISTPSTSTESGQLQKPPKSVNDEETTTAAPSATNNSAEDVNIFNTQSTEKVTTEEEKDNTVPSFNNHTEELITKVTTTEPTLTETVTSSPVQQTTTNAAQTKDSVPVHTSEIQQTTPTNLNIDTATTSSIGTNNNTGTNKNEEVVSNDCENIENILTSTVAPNIQGNVHTQNGNKNSVNNANSANQKLSSSAQSESIFSRLSNRIKVLERNMSLSALYLEELSRVYNKQVEELQLMVTQTTQTVRLLEEHTRRHRQVEEKFAEKIEQLSVDLDNVTLELHIYRMITTCLGALVLVLLLVGIMNLRTVQRSIFKNFIIDSNKNNKNNVSNESLKLPKRRKSFEVSTQAQSQCAEKLRRPSEECALILNHYSASASDSTELINDFYKGNKINLNENMNKNNSRQRKFSVCYDSAKSTHIITNRCSTEKAPHLNMLQHVEDLGFIDTDIECYDKFVTEDKHVRQRINGQAKSKYQNFVQLDGPKSKSKKRAQQLKRQESAPSELITFTEPYLNRSVPNKRLLETSDYNESLLLDDDGLDNFIPNSDMVYNEFMPEGPSGCQIITNENIKTDPTSKTAGAGMITAVTGANTKKAKRITSPAFFKSAFSKNGKIKVTKQNPPHESTSWEWHRLRKSEQHKIPKQHMSTSTSNNSLKHETQIVGNDKAASVDSTSLSEINFPTNFTTNSFRILEEAILTSGECNAVVTNGSGNS
ncbi:SUN domain-containing ossification factor isoform X3 [Teleopsis dalmanni]|uniref:SUN domain-containing ossification factor isoform X3 n=1 Tax=Teleopsis dalmanni TaxID=139649 RepID=UPI0018CCDD52|nr:SUN domain-containing ossification factor isoform X3 [Teleopsis dalmanni]